MNRKATTAVSRELAPVLEVVSRMNLASAAAISQTLGRAAPQYLLILCNQGQIRKQIGRRFDGTPATLYAITAKGIAALHELANAAEPSAPAPTNGPEPLGSRSAYDGLEMQPFVARQGSQDALRHPSRVGDRLCYRNGAVELIDTNAGCALQHRKRQHLCEEVELRQGEGPSRRLSPGSSSLLNR